MVTKLEQMMKKEGWILGFTENYNMKYWSFRKGDFEIPTRCIDEVPLKDEDTRNFKKWRKG